MKILSIRSIPVKFNANEYYRDFNNNSIVCVIFENKMIVIKRIRSTIWK